MESPPASVLLPSSGASAPGTNREGDWRIRFDRNELAGAFGDIGTDLPLLVGVMLAARMDAAGALIMFGTMQILTGLRYRMPMPVQPLKAMAAIVIAHQVDASVLAGGALAIGVAMLVLALTGCVDWVSRAVPKAVVRGIQFGLGLQLVTLALGKYVAEGGATGYALASVGLVIVFALTGNRRYPAALAVVGLGTVYAAVFTLDARAVLGGIGLRLPQPHFPSFPDIVSGFVVLALPQLPLSLGNSILATRQLSRDLFPDRAPTVRAISLTYAAMNLLNPMFGGVPTCHGSGGMAGHYAFGGRTGGSVILYGGFFLATGLFLSAGFHELANAFPLPLLGVLLVVEGLTLMALVRDLLEDSRELFVALLVGSIAVTVPYGYIVALVAGTALSRLPASELRSGRALDTR
ncbi:MAG: putative sulfate/molybdate transporter [Vicinamibacterales bacterium]